MPNVTEIAVANLTTTEKFFDHFVVEMHADNTGNNRVGIQEARGTWNVTNSNFQQDKPLYFTNATVGTTYYFRAAVVDKYGNQSAWSAWDSLAAGSSTAPNPTYSPVAAVCAGGIRVSAGPVSPAATINHYEFYWSTTNTAPTASSLANLPNSTNAVAHIIMAAGDTAYVWVRAVDTFGNKQAWTSLGGFNSSGQSVGTALVTNGDFEQGDVSWPTKGTGWSIVQDAVNSYPGGSWCAEYSGTVSAAIRNAIKIPVQAGDVLASTCMAKRVSGTQGVWLRIVWLGSDGVTELAYSLAPAVTSTTYVSNRVVGTAPANAFYGRIEAATDGAGSSATVAYFDNFNASMFPKNLDEIGDGTNYARTVGTDLTGNRLDFSKNLLNKHLGNVPDDATSSRYAVLAVDANRRAIVDFSQTHVNKILDNIADGVSFVRTTPNQRDGGGRGFAALDANNRLAGTFRNNQVNVTSVWSLAPTISQSGATTTILIAASTAQYGDGTVTYTSGSVNPGSVGTYYIYADDPTFAGGAVTYQVSPSKPTLTAGNGRVVFGQITTVSGGGGSGGGTSTCPAEDQIMETLERGFVQACEIKAGEHVRDFDEGVWNLAERAWSVDGWLVHTTIGGETYHVDVDHLWLRSGGDPDPDSDGWIRQHNLRVGDELQAADGSVHLVGAISEPHKGRYRKIICERHRMRMGKLIAHNYPTS